LEVVWKGWSLEVPELLGGLYVVIENAVEGTVAEGGIARV